MEYKILIQPFGDLLEDEVNRLIREGFEPLGGASVCCYYDRLDGMRWLHQQAMVRRGLSHNASVTGGSAPQPETTMKDETTAIEPPELPHLLVDDEPEALGAMRAELMDARLRLQHYERGEEAMKNRITALLNALRIGAEALREYAGSCEALDSMELELSCFADDVKPNANVTGLAPGEGLRMNHKTSIAQGPVDVTVGPWRPHSLVVDHFDPRKWGMVREENGQTIYWVSRTGGLRRFASLEAAARACAKANSERPNAV